MKLYKILFLFLLTALYSCKKQDVAIDSSGLKVYDFSINKCVNTYDNGFLLLGDKTLAKVNAEGEIDWNKSSYGADYVVPLKNGNSLICIDVNTYMFVEMIGSSGNSAKTFSLTATGGSRMANPMAIELTSGELLFMGTSVNGIDSSLYMIKTKPTGSVIWNKKVKLNFNFAQIHKAIESTNINELILIGNTGKVSNKNGMCVVKIDTSGAIVWQNKKNFGIWENYATDIHHTGSGKYVITGYYDKSTTVDYNYQFYALQINNTGDSLKLFTNGSSKQDYCITSNYIAAQDNIIMVGMEGRGRNTEDLSLANIKVLTVNTSLTSVASDNIYAQIQACQAMSVIKNSDGSLSVIGKKYAYDNKNIVHAFFMKIKSDGTF